MSKLPGAPLLEVIFELKWEVNGQQDILDFQYLHGDLFSNIKQDFSRRENVTPPGFPYEVFKGNPVFRYRPELKDYPLVQVGPGLLSVNTVDDIYFWEDYMQTVKKIYEVYSNIYPKSIDIRLTPALTYIDFFEYDKNKQSSVDFINENLQLDIKEHGLKIEGKKIKDINLTINYDIGQNGFSLNIRDGQVNNDKTGIVMQSKLIGEKGKYNNQKLGSWLNDAHKICSDTFKSLTEGKLYDSFK